MTVLKTILMYTLHVLLDQTLYSVF